MATFNGFICTQKARCSSQRLQLPGPFAENCRRPKSARAILSLLMFGKPSLQQGLVQPFFAGGARKQVSAPVFQERSKPRSQGRGEAHFWTIKVARRQKRDEGSFQKRLSIFQLGTTQ